MSFPQRVTRSLRIAGRLSMATGLWSIAFAVALVGPVCAQETAITIEPRPGVTMRFLLEAPVKAAGSVILVAGGHGTLDLAPRLHRQRPMVDANGIFGFVRVP